MADVWIRNLNFTAPQEPMRVIESALATPFSGRVIDNVILVEHDDDCFTSHPTHPRVVKANWQLMTSMTATNIMNKDCRQYLHCA